MLDFNNFQDVFSWVVMHGYLIIFLVMCVEGPITTAAAGFGAALGYFNPAVIFLISIMGDLIPDSVYYFIGYRGRGAVVEKAVRYFGLSPHRMDRIESELKKHFGKTMIAMKLTPVIPTPGFMLVGYLRLSFIEFTKYSALVTIIKSALFLALGYYFGKLYNINEYLHYAGILFPLAGMSLILAYFIYKKAAAAIVKKTKAL